MYGEMPKCFAGYVSLKRIITLPVFLRRLQKTVSAFPKNNSVKSGQYRCSLTSGGCCMFRLACIYLLLRSW